MKKYLAILLFVMIFVLHSVSFVSAIDIIDKGKISLKSFVSGTVKAHESIEQHQYDSTSIIKRVNIQGTLSLKGNGATPLNYIEILKLDSDGIVYCIISLWHLPYKVKENRIQVSRIIVNNSDSDYDFPSWTGLKVNWILYK